MDIAMLTKKEKQPTIHYLHPDFEEQSEPQVVPTLKRPSPLALLAETCKNICLTKIDPINQSASCVPTGNSSSSSGCHKEPPASLSPPSSAAGHKRSHSPVLSSPRRSSSSSSEPAPQKRSRQQQGQQVTAPQVDPSTLSASILTCLTDLFKQTNPDLEKIPPAELLHRLSRQLSQPQQQQQQQQQQPQQQPPIKYCMYCGKCIPFLPLLMAHISTEHNSHSLQHLYDQSPQPPPALDSLIRNFYPHYYPLPPGVTQPPPPPANPSPANPISALLRDFFPDSLPGGLGHLIC